MIYTVRESETGFFVEKKDKTGEIVDVCLVTKDLNKFSCSCPYFQRTQNEINHFHILVVKEWLKRNKPEMAMYIKNRDNKLEILSSGYYLE